MLIQSDYHIHASFYRVKGPGADPGPTAAEQLAAARSAGSRYVGILEHCNGAAHHPFYCLEQLSAEYHALGFDRENVFLGTEADLAEDGTDFCGRAGREKLGLHYVIGSVHLSPVKTPDFSGYLNSEYRRIVNALKSNGNIEIIGHPFGEGIRWEKAGIIPKWDWSLIPENHLTEILHLAAETGKALEVNRCDFSDPVYLDFLKEVRDRKILFTAGSDAHDTCGTVLAAERTRFLEGMGFQEEYHWRPVF